MGPVAIMQAATNQNSKHGTLIRSKFSTWNSFDEKREDSFCCGDISSCVTRSLPIGQESVNEARKQKMIRRANV